jgi:hypothetical protein
MPYAALKLALALTLVALVVPLSASAQATRTWVSGVGDDANPCSRTAPCRTLAGAQSKTAPGGQISGLDGGGFGAITINKSLTIDLRRIWEPGVLTNVSNGITVNAAATDRVKILGPNINGLNSNFHGIRILQARSVKIHDVHIFGFNRNAISVENATALIRVVVADSKIHDNGGAGVMVAPQGSNTARVTVRNNDIDDNGCGIVASRFGIGSAFNFANNCAANGTNTATASINAFRNSISDPAFHGVLGNGNTATVRLALNEITGSGDLALRSLNSAPILTFGNNFVTDNPGGNGAATGSADAL